MIKSRPSFIRVVKRLGGRAFWGPQDLWLIHCVDVCSSLFSVFGHSLNTIIIRGIEGGRRGGRGQWLCELCGRHCAVSQPASQPASTSQIGIQVSQYCVSLSQSLTSIQSILVLWYGRPGLAQFMRTLLDVILDGASVPCT